MTSKNNKIVFAGSGNFAVPILKNLLESFEVSLVITRPPRPAGKGKKMRYTPVFDLATALGLPVVTPEKIEAVNEEIKCINPAVIVVTDYGAMIPKSTLDVPHLGVINIHPSLLPKYRGPSPIQATLLNGDSLTGISIMLIDEKMDHGPILYQTQYSIPDNMTAVELENELAELSAKCLPDVIMQYVVGSASPVEQNHNEATFCKLIKKADGNVTNEDTIESVRRKVKALQPWPGTWVTHPGNNGQIRIAILRTGQAFHNTSPGSHPVLYTQDRNLLLSLKNGTLEILELKPETKKTMTAGDFINGYLSS
jgi:methionyl-tRNA formyltransferase